MSSTKQVLERHLAAWNRRDADADPWSADAEMIAPGTRISGREQILAFERSFWEAFPDARLAFVASIAEGTRAAGEGKLTGTHQGVLRTPDGDVPPTGRRVEFRWMAMYEVRGDELVSEHLYFDPSELSTQLG